MEGLKRCRACTATVTGNRLFCTAPVCQRKAAAERKARQRAKAAQPDAIAKAPGPSGPEPIMSPWGRVYSSAAELVADCVLAGGLAGDVTTALRRAWVEMLPNGLSEPFTG